MKTHITNEKFIETITILCSMMSIRDLADNLRLSQTSITRWMTGKNLPVQCMRLPIVKYLESKLATN
jgi:hypothetical protein